MHDPPRGTALLIVDNSHERWKVADYLREWYELSKRLDVATGHFEIGGLLALGDTWQQVDTIRIIMGDEVSIFLTVTLMLILVPAIVGLLYLNQLVSWPWIRWWVYGASAWLGLIPTVMMWQAALYGTINAAVGAVYGSS